MSENVPMYEPSAPPPVGAKSKRGLKITLLLVGCGCGFLLAILFFTGFFTAILIPVLANALQEVKQDHTVTDMRKLGTAWMEWMTVHHGTPGAGQTPQVYDLEALPRTLTAAELSNLLFGTELPLEAPEEGLAEVPETDGWNNPLEFRMRLDPPALSIRSAGRDATFWTDTYPIDGFITTDYDQDIVWADGYFVRRPETGQ